MFREDRAREKGRCVLALQGRERARARPLVAARAPPSGRTRGVRLSQTVGREGRASSGSVRRDTDAAPEVSGAALRHSYELCFCFVFWQSLTKPIEEIIWNEILDERGLSLWTMPTC